MASPGREPSGRVREDTDRQRGLADPWAWNTVGCVVCHTACLPPDGGLQVMCGDCTVRVGDALTRQRLRTSEGGGR